MSPLGMYVKRRREQRGWTLAELSRQSNVPYGTLRNIEQNKRAVKAQEQTIRALSEALGEDSPDILFALAGYGIPLTATEETRNHVIEGLLQSRPEWRTMLHHIAEKLPPEEQDHALQVLRVFINLP